MHYYSVILKKSAQRDANTARALAEVRFGHRSPARPPARCKHTNPQTGPITIHIHCAAASYSAQCNNETYNTIDLYSTMCSEGPTSSACMVSQLKIRAFFYPIVKAKKFKRSLTVATTTLFFLPHAINFSCSPYIPFAYAHCTAAKCVTALQKRLHKKVL